MKTKIETSCLHFVFLENPELLGTAQDHVVKKCFSLCGICVASSNSTLDSTDKIQAECFLSSAFY